MVNTITVRGNSTGSASNLRFVSSQSQPKLGAEMHVPSGTCWAGTYIQTLTGQLLSGWALHEPISLIVEPDDDGYIASDSITTVYGYGSTGPDAVQDYVVSLCEYYELLEAANTMEAYQTLERLGRYLIKIPH